MSEQGKSGKLLAALPEVLANVAELGRICELEQPLFDKARAAVDEVLAENFVETCTEVGLLRLEELLKIIPSEGASEAERKRAVLFRLNEQLPFTYGKLEELLAMISLKGEYSLELIPSEQRLNVNLSLYCKPEERLIKEVLERTVPCNILWDLLWDYNRHSYLTAYTQAELGEMTHLEMREEVLK